MDREEKGENVGRMLDLIRRRELLRHNRSEDEHWLKIETEIVAAPVQIEILLPGNRWSTPRELQVLPPVGVRYESRMHRWNLDCMVEAFDSIYGRHPSVLGPWVTLVRQTDRRTYHGRDAWDMTLLAAHFRQQRGLRPMRGEDDPEETGGGTEADPHVLSVEIHTEIQAPYRGRRKGTVLEFHRDGDRYVEVVRFAAASTSSEFLGRVLQNILWGRPAPDTGVAELRAQITDLVSLFLPGPGEAGWGGAAAS